MSWVSQIFMQKIWKELFQKTKNCSVSLKGRVNFQPQLLKLELENVLH